MISIRRVFLVLFVVASLLSAGTAWGLYLHASSSPVRVEVLFQFPSTGKDFNMVQAANKEIVLPLAGRYSVVMKGNAELYIQTASGLYKNPAKISVEMSRVVRVIIINQSSDVLIELRHEGAPTYAFPLVAVVLSGVVGLAVGMLKFE